MKAPIEILPLTAEWLPALQAESAATGGHHAPLSTHVFVRSGEVVGAAGLDVPTFTFFPSHLKLHRRETVELFQRCQAEMAKGGRYLGQCPRTSPFHPLVPSFGGKILGNADLFIFEP